MRRVSSWRELQWGVSVVGGNIILECQVGGGNLNGECQVGGGIFNGECQVVEGTSMCSVKGNYSQ